MTTQEGHPPVTTSDLTDLSRAAPSSGGTPCPASRKIYVTGPSPYMIFLDRDLGKSGSRVGDAQLLLSLMDLRVRCNALGT